MTKAIAPRIRTKVAAVMAAAGLVVPIAACSTNNDSAAGDSTATDAKISVVASTKVWSDIANEVIGDAKNISVTPIIESNDIDPHSYQPTAADMAKVEKADILLAGGGHYDAWLTSAVSDKGDQVIISALPTENADEHAGHDHADEHAGHDHADEHAEDAHADEHAEDAHADEHAGHDHGETEVNEHIWYDTKAVKDVAEKLAKELNVKADGVVKKMDAIEKMKSELKAAKTAQVHPLADDIIKDTKVNDITPQGYREATLKEGEPSAADVNAMLKLIESGELDYLIDAPQTHDQISERLVEAAKAKGVKIVNVYEAPAKGQSYFDLYEQTLNELERN